MFKKWLSDQSFLTTYTFQDLALTKINSIYTHLIFDKVLSLPTSTADITINQTETIETFINDLALRTIFLAEEIAQSYVEKVNNEKTKLLNNGKKFQRPLVSDTIISAIENRQINMIQRAQYNIEQLLAIVYGKNVSIIE
jgi:hypothetical protein